MEDDLTKGFPAFVDFVSVHFDTLNDELAHDDGELASD